MYTTRNFKTKAALKLAVATWLESQTLQEAGVPTITRGAEPVTLFAPGLGAPKMDGVEYVEGPHYPAPHTWYAEVVVKGGVVVKVK